MGDCDAVLALLLSLRVPAHVAELCAPTFAQHGFDSRSALGTLTPEDLDYFGLKEGHKRLVLASLKQELMAPSRKRPLEDVSSSCSKPPAVSPAAKTPAPKGWKRRPAVAAAAAPGEGAARLAATKGATASRWAKARRRSSAGLGGDIDGLVICVSGALSKVRREFWRQVQEHGGEVTKTVTGRTTHMVTTEREAFCPTRKVLQAIKKRTPIVSEQFVIDCIEGGCVIDYMPYLLRDMEEAAGSMAAPRSAAGEWPAGSRSGRGGSSSASGGAAHLNMPEVLRGTAERIERKPDAASAAAARKVMLATRYEEHGRMDPTGWWISEKLDGVRGYWDGKDFYSRNGNQFPSPEWFKKGLPSTPLDGELWCGRRQFRQCLSIVRSGVSGQLWKYITFWVFDAPAMTAPYEERVEHIHRTVVPGEAGCPHAAPVGIIRCEGKDQLRRELAKVTAKGGEGLMLREPGSAYENKRSKVLRKVKPVHDEEAKVVGHEGGMGPTGPHCGALTLETPDSRRFSCGTGLSAADRRTPPAVGTVVTYRYVELMDNGYPRFPSYIGPRIDLDWDTICAGYEKPSAECHKAPGLKKSHSILYSEAALARTLSVPLELAEEGREDATTGSSRGPAPSSGVSRSSPSRPSRLELAARAAAAAEARQAVAQGPGAMAAADRPSFAAAASSSAAALAPPHLERSRSQALAEEAGLDLETARLMLAENDEAAQG